MIQDMTHCMDKNMAQGLAMKARVALTGLVLLLTSGNIAAQGQGDDGPIVRGSVYGGGNAADVMINTTVHIETGQVIGNVYGGGKQGDVGTVDKSDQTTYNYIWTSNNNDDPDDDTGLCTVEILGGTIGDENISTANHASGHVFGAGEGDAYNYWCEKGMVYKTSVSISKGTIYGNVYGGGEVGRVENDTEVTIEGASATVFPEIKGSVFGAGAGLETHGYSALVRNNSYVTVGGYAKVRQNVYGGGEVATVGRYWVNTDPPMPGAPPVPDGVRPGMPYKQRSGGLCTVIVQGHAEIGPKDAAASETAGHIFGAGKGATPAFNAETSKKMTQGGDLEGFTAETGKTAEDVYKEFLETLALVTHTDVTIGGTTDGGAVVKGSVYGGSENGFVQHNVSVGIRTGCTIGTTTTNTTTTSYGDVYGGGKGLATFAAAGRVTGHVTIDVAGGTAYGSVYGGGQLGVTNGGVDVKISGGEVKKDVYGGGALADTNTDDYELVFGLTSTSSVKGLYTKTNSGSGDTYTEITTETTAEDDTEYYRKTATSVSLIGGVIGGDVYGGGLGRMEDTENSISAVEALVYGDVTVDLNKNWGTCQINGSVFGCNNLNGTPKGDVRVNVYGTSVYDTDGTSIKAKPTKFEDLDPSVAYTDVTDLQLAAHTFELQGVFGGGNEAAYSPNTGKTTAVNILGCSTNSIKEVYGGGNAAAVPATTVVVNGAHEIGYVYAGGKGTSSVAADVNGNASTTIYGGTVYRTFAGSNTNGDITGTSTLTISERANNHTDYCELKMGDVFSYGNMATMSGTSQVSIGCTTNKIGALYGGAMNAHIGTSETPRDIVLNINGGKFHQVFGGNKDSGTINGSITVNIEQTDCNIEIDELYGCGNNAAYTTPDDEDDPQINIISCTTIGNIYGGGLGSAAVVTGNPEININMAYGSGQTGALGTIGNVYGGGSAADVVGNTTVNIGTNEYEVLSSIIPGETDVKGYYIRTGTASNYVYTLVEGTTIAQPNTVYCILVRGANITGSVYGGGYGAGTTVTGDVAVNVGGEKTVNNTTTYIGGTITIAGSVYGGSAFGAVNATRGESGLSPNSGKTTEVTLKKGSVSGYVFGGGQGNSTTTAHVYCNSIVTLYGDVVARGLYGGCDVNGKMHGDTKLNLIGGTVGASSAPTANILFGGGLGQATTVDGNVTVNVGSYSTEFASYAGNPVTIWGNVYGGGALGDVNTGTPPTGTTYTTTVNLFKGTVHGDVFGGGLGQTAVEAQDAVYYTSVDEYNTAKGTSLSADEFAELTDKQKIKTPAVTGQEAIAAAVNGNIRVDLNGYNDLDVTAENPPYGSCIVTGNIFGCNNTYGSPGGDAEVHIYKTVAPDESHQRTANPAAENVTHTYELQRVFGGGNNAPFTTTGKTARVFIESCEVSIEEVYGGGYGATSNATHVEVKGAYEIGTVFGGGYGAGSDDPTAADYNPGADVETTAEVELKGGVIHEVYGGSNTKGNVKVSASVIVNDDDTGCCDLAVDNIYGAGKNASMSGDVNIVMGCQPDKLIEEVYAGSKRADVDGNVSLTITSGKFGRVFGGNKYSGALKGSITVNIEETTGTTCGVPIIIGELYAGGNLADYSIYGYDSDGKAIESGGTPLYNDPKLNIRSFTSIGKVFGGGYKALMVANPTVNINVAKGSKNGSGLTAGSFNFDVKADDGTVEEAGLSLAYPAHAAGEIGAIGDVYGGGNLAKIIGSATVNIGTETTVGFVTEPIHLRENPEVAISKTNGLYVVPAEGATIIGDVFGGGNLADITGDTHVNICAKEVTNSDNTTSWQKVTYGTGLAGVSIDKKTDGKGGSVFGGGSRADVLGNTYVRMSGGYVFNGVFGGGYAGNVGTFDVRDKTLTIYNFDHSTRNELHSDCIGKPTHCVDGTGKCTVVVDGGQIGPIEVATQGMTRTKDGKYDPVPQGWVWGGGQGLIEDPAVEKDTHFKSYVGSTDVTIGGDAFILESVIGGGEFGRVLYDTKVTITGDCQIGVGEDQKETVNGVLKPKRYDPDDFIDPAAGVTSEQALTACSHFPYGKEISGKIEYLPYDPYYDEYCENPTFAANHLDLSPASTKNASDGKTWIGCVFAGGSGYMPYRKKDGSGYDWCSSAGLVERNAELYIEGGHILTNVYGGNEYTNVKGTCTVKMTGGTIGVPRTLEQIQAHPVICNLFGAGKGDQRKHFNKETNVGDVEVIVEGGIIYGSVFGGGEDGHVLRDVKVTIGKDDDHTGPKIGTWGTSYMDGNVFGGGRGFGGDAYTAGNVAGSVDLKIKGGTILGSVYGGGRLGSVGYGLYDATADGYGEMRDDNKDDAGTTTTYYKDGLNKLGRGHVDITISGGTIGNTHEYIVPSASNTPSSLNINIDDIASWTDDNWKTWKTYNNIPLTEFDKETYRLKHTKSGNVFTGGMGRRFKLDGVTEIDETTDGIDWKKLGNVKSTKLTISGNAQIKIMGNVYGGGELGAVTGNHQLLNGTTPVTDTNGDPVVAGTEINIDGSNCVIGTEVGTGSDKYYFGSVYGGGMGEIYEEGTGSSATTVLAGGNVNDSTKVSMSNGSVRGSVYGGGELGQVFGSADVAVSGGSIGVSGFGGAEYGNIYGGGKGSTEKLDAGLIKTNTWVTVSGSPQIWHNIYGGGAYGSVGTITRGSDATYIHVPGQTSVPDMPKSWAENTGSALVRILGGTVGRNGNENGMVFGSSRGDLGAPGEIHDKLAWVKKAKVVIGATGTTGPNIKGSVYGSGENGHLFQDAVVEIHSGVVGIAEGEAIGSYTAGGASYPYRGNVYGGGCGTDKYDNNTKYNPLAGIVLGDASVTMDGGTVVHNIYGAGAMGSVGTMTTDANNHLVISSGGTTTIAISGGTVGVSGTVGVGNVFGAARGDSLYTEKGVAQVRSTSVTISQADGKTTMIYGNVYGGGETGDVGTYTNTYTSTGSKNYVWDKIDSKEIGGCSVSVTGGQIKGNVFGAGKGVANSFECEKAIVRTATVSVSAGTVNGNVYGGGEIGRVDQNTKVTIGDETATSGTSSPVIAGDVFGAGAGKETHGYSALVRGDAEVIIQGNAAVGKSVYGGGEIAAVGRYGLDSDNMPTTLVSGGECKVTVKGSAKIGTVSGGNVFGAGKGVNPFDDDHTYIDFTSNSESKWPKRMTIKPGAGQTLPVHYTEINGTDYIWEYYTSKEDYFKYLQTLALATDTKVSIEGSATVNGSVYGGSESGFVQRDTEIKIQGGEIGSADTNGTITTEGNVYGGGKGLSGFDNAGRVSGGVTIAVSDGTTHGDVYGGGELGVVKGAVLVNILGGTIDEDVYGGGALANTNTNNWDGTALTETYLEVGGLIAGTSSVTGYYTKSGDNYTLLDSGTAAAGTKYYRKVNTTVNLLGGTIKGDAYGGGLGQKKDFNGAATDIAAVVYGDISVTLDGAAFEINKYTDAGYTNVVKSGRVFGCNNLNGSPQGDVTVTVNQTVAGNFSRTPASIKVDGYGKKLLDDPDYQSTYEVAAVYGGGNLAPYKTTGKKTHVIINGCGKTSIETVYGGGNAAAVPESKVDVNGTYEIGCLFGGGNGKDRYWNGSQWVPNPGANVGKTVDGEVIGNGNTTTWIYGGTIHEAYGASNEKGTITGNVFIDVASVATTDANYCKLDVGKMVGAGKNADVNGDIITILGCKPGEEIPIWYGGADNANVNGNVELTITSGNFGQVFGGNNVGGIINGHIILNIEEITPCNTPINIKKLYLGGNRAAYSVYGYYVVTDDNGQAVLTKDKLTFEPRTSADDSHKPVKTYAFDEAQNKWTWENYTGRYDATAKKWYWTVSEGVEKDVLYDQPELNVISCTSIDELFGGGYGVGGDMYADPTVNINMIQGTMADGVPGKMTLKGLTPSDNPNNLGIIGTVYGGGDAADVVGNTTVNIGTKTNVDIFELEMENGAPILGEGGSYIWKTTKKNVPVLGAYIVSNVYGGGKLANVGATHLGTDDDGNTIDVIDAPGNTFVNIGTSRDAVLNNENQPTGEYEYHTVAITGTDYEGVKILGNVFGGGEGEAAESGDGAFRCGKAMVTGGTNICIGNGTIGNFDANGKLLSGGFVYGGGEVGRVEENTRVTIGLGDGGTTPASAPVIGNDVFGAGKGEKTHGYSALVRGNTYVTIQGDAKLKESVYGGGEIASVGRYNVVKASDLTDEFKQEHPELEVGMPWSLANSTSGNCYVVVRGNAEIGPDTPMKMTADGGPDDTGHVFGAGKGVLPYEGYSSTDPSWHVTATPWRMQPNNEKEEYGDGTNASTEAKYLAYIETLALATQTDVTISGNAFVKGSVYGGSENGHVQHSTHVTIAGGQIGAGEGMNERYTGWPTETENISTSWKECAHWTYDKDDAAPWDMYAKYTSGGMYYYDAACTQTAEGGYYIAKDGHTFYGNVFGGGSGLVPYAPGKWHRAAGSVGGNTVVDITGGHILTSVYGGNEQTDVGTYRKDEHGALVVPVRDGKCTINMTGGTVGVPRTEADMKAHPHTCYVFGAGKGDQRIFFNTWTNVINSEVNITGDARIYGSTFGGGEDGHVIHDAVTNIGGSVTIGTGTAARTYTENGVLIGTTGTSYVDGNVFGGGRGFSGDAQTAGTVGGNVEVNIEGGTILGSVYGGGRLASVGTEFTAPDDPNYGQFKEDDNNGTYGHVTVNIGGSAVIGNGEGGKDVTSKGSGNVFGGSMGRLTLLNGEINDLWPKLGQVKSTTVNIYGNAVVKRTVFGGGELGTVRDDAYVTIGGKKTSNAVTDVNGNVTVGIGKEGSPIVRHDVYGGGYGSEDFQTETTVTVYLANSANTNTGYDEAKFRYTPMQWAGCVGKNTYVNVVGGQVRKSVYGGGEMASVGIINYQLDENNNCIGIIKHNDVNNGFALSWPYEFKYFPGFDGATHVTVKGGRIGLKGTETNTFEDKDNGDVVGGGKGIAGDFNNYMFCANVGSSLVTIDYENSSAKPESYEREGDCITGAVYGGAENGHVMGNSKLILKSGLVGHSIYGGGSGKGQFTKTLDKIAGVSVVTNNSTSPAATPPTQTSNQYDATIYSITAGKVFGDSEVEMIGGYVVRNVYGGGNLGSVGKGNYSGGADDYSKEGYGETLTGNLWTTSATAENPDNAWHFLNSGRCKVKITGGTVGYIDFSKVSDYMYDNLPYGNVFGGCRGKSAPNIGESPRYQYSPSFFSGYANETEVTIGTAGSSTGPKIIGSVYGGGMDGHVRRDTKVTINSGEIGRAYTGDGSTVDLEKVEWSQCGNVYGAGSGIGKYEYDFNYDGDYEDVVDYTNPQNSITTRMKERDFSTSAGSVTRFTEVEVKGGTIHRNVYGGGSLSSVGAPKIPPITDDPIRRDDSNTSTQGLQSLNKVIVSGGQIGDAAGVAKGYGGDVNGGSRGDIDLGNSFSTAVFADVTINGTADIKGNVFGGGEAGMVKHDTNVKMAGGTVGNDLYGGGNLADVGGNTVVDMTGGTIKHDAFGGARGTANVAAEVKGNATVTLDGTKFIPAFDTNGILTGGRIFGANNVNGTPKGHVKVHVLQTVDSAKDPSVALADRTTYDVGAVYGGGNNADYRPTSTAEFAEVIIDGCEKTSIKYVFGGANAAATPANDVVINGCYIIDNVFGGGNGTVSPANVGYDEAAIGDTPAYKTLGTAKTNLSGGYIHNVYGGSNNQGDILGGASVTNEKYTGPGCCETLQVQEIYGGGKQADMFGGAEIVLGCMPGDWIGAIYAGAENADVGSDVSLTLTSGKFERVFGGNKSGGRLNGGIEVNIEENPTCSTPIIIGELYGGGNEAPYSIYGYKGLEANGKGIPRTESDYKALTDDEKAAEGILRGPNHNPVVNVKAFTSIGNIFGGGYGKTAVMIGNPIVNINEVEFDKTETGYQSNAYDGETKTIGTGDDAVEVVLYPHEDGKMGVIGNVFGGGNAAEVIGNTNVNIGTEAEVGFESLRTSEGVPTKPVVGANIKGNVYGGGNNASVTGDTNVTIGKEKVTTP